MARTKGSKNKKIQSGRIKTSTLTSTERLHLLTNLIIDRIIHDQNHGAVLLTKIRKEKV